MTNQLNIKNLDAIIFDLGGVILNIDYDLTINAFKKLGGENFDKLYTQAHQDLVFDKYETGKITSTEFIEYLRSFLPGNISPTVVIEAWNAMLLDLPANRIELLEQLKKTYRIFLFSNTNDLHFQFFSELMERQFGNRTLLQDLFEKAYFSHLVGQRKPNVEAFELVIKNHNLDKNTTLFIDDSVQHIEGAKKAGLLTKHLVREDIIDIFDLTKT
ncbi:MAG: HAD family phosphatase [Crocinitomicaceae bacterium]|nr:HAD family phosphatase [Crocinitomicaceae bacterium]